MNKHADKISENKSQAVANSVPKQQSIGESTFQLADNNPEAIVQQKLQEAINNSSRVKQLKAYQAMANNFTSQTTRRKENSEEEALQGKLEPVQKKENNTGLPDNLKSGVENLSGYSMDDVKVHYNSDKPASLQAHAYAQGTDIHLASGQEKHLPHEAWHVVQQKQGRVKPTVQMKNDVPVNDDAGLEHEADVMGEKALGQGTKQMQGSLLALQRKADTDAGLVRQNQVVQLAREYDETLSPHKAKLTQWLVETNQTLGLSQDGKSGTIPAKKKSNFSWHHILAFADLAKHGEGKTAPANHGGNLRLGPMKNRFEAYDVGGGTAVDYGYQPLDENEDIVLDDYSKGVFDGTIKASDKSSLTNKLTSGTSAKTLQAENFTEGKEAGVFGEWFLESQMKNTLLSKGAITGKLQGALSKDMDVFINKINAQFDGLLRTYKYYNKKKEIQITSGVPMTDISEGNFGQITITKGEEEEVIKASTVIDELLRDEKWVKRGSQGELQDETTTYKFGLASYASFIKLIEDAATDIDLAGYKAAKLIEFKSELITAFSDFRATGKENENFAQGKENALIASLVENLKTGAATYDLLWNGIEEAAIEEQYVRVKIDVSGKDWVFPTPEVGTRRSAITDTASAEHSEVSDAWNEVFVDKLSAWDKKTPLFEEGIDPTEQTYIDYSAAGKSINANEQKWKMTDINQERQENSNKLLPKTFLTENMTVDNVDRAVAKTLSENREDYLSNEKEDLTLDDVKEELKNSVGAHFNVFSKRLKGVEKDIDKRRLAFGADFEGFVNSTKWNVINSSKIPTDVEGTEGKKWADLGDVQKTLYDQWLEQGNVAVLIAGASTSDKLAKMLP